MKRASCSLILITLVLLATGCPSDYDEPEIWLQRTTVVPVTKTGEVVNPNQPEQQKRITISSGIAIGLGCTEYCPDSDSSRPSCEDTEISVVPAGLADIHEAYLLNGQPGAAVLVANDPGVGAIIISSPCATAQYQLTIVP